MKCQAAPAVQRSSQQIVVTSGRLRLSCDLKQGLWNAQWGDGSQVNSLDAVSCAALLQDSRSLDSSRSSSHECGSADVTRISDKFGHGVQLVVHHRSAGAPELRQQFRVYAGLPYFLTSVSVVAPARIASNNITVISCDSATTPDAGVHLDQGGTPQTLFVPYDNDNFVRYSSSGAKNSYEATAVYDNAGRHGVVLGSATHDTWKTGITIDNISTRSVGKLDIYGGVADKQTWDSQPHGFVRGRVLRSPEIFVGCFSDWRAGMEAYGQANARIHPPLAWDNGVIFGWNSWMAYEAKISAERYVAASDFFKSSLQPRGFSNKGVVYINLDSFWDRMTEAQMEAAVRHIHAYGQRAGIYWTPFVYWKSDLSAPVEGTNRKYTYADILLKDENGKALPKLDTGQPLDPSHPGTLARIDWQLHKFVTLGFDFVKLDFMSHGALEGRHFDPNVTTGVEAYNLGMQRIVNDLKPEKIGRPFFISLSIAPLFPSGYAHSRRIACDTWGQLSNSEYLLNSLTYGWWEEGTLYKFDDPDCTVLTEKVPTIEQEARTRLDASVVTGTMLLDSDPLTEPAAQQRAARLLTNPEINALARVGRSFHPVEGDTGNRADDKFVLTDPKTHVAYIAVFNFSLTDPKTMKLDLNRLGLDPAEAYRVRDLWTHSDSSASGTLSVDLLPAQSTILRLTRASGSTRGAPG